MTQMLFSLWTSIPIQTTTSWPNGSYVYKMARLQRREMSADDVDYVVIIHDVKV